MKKLAILTVLSLGLWTASAQIYVSPNGDPNNSGTIGWSDALDDLQDAINRASTMNPIPDIWVAEGTYTPQQRIPGGTSNRDRSFFIYNKDIKIYGGFPSTGNSGWAQRDPKTNVTTLSGDIIGTENAILDGCTIIAKTTQEEEK